MVVRNGMVFKDDGGFAPADLELRDGRIARVAPPGSLQSERSFDAEGGYVLPGFVDIHTHGGAGRDFADADAAALPPLLGYYASEGVTSVLATLVALPHEALAHALATARLFAGADGFGAVVRGFRLEGLFVSPARGGCQDTSCMLPPTQENFERYNTLADGRIKILDVAPELPGAPALIAKLCRQCVVSLAHSNADYDTAMAAFAAGASHVGHLFNAMPPFLHRAPGLVGAASDRAAYVELIADGEHLHPAVVRAAFAWFTPGRVCLVSDSMRAAGMPDGTYRMGSETAVVQAGRVSLADGTLAGSAASLAACCRRAVDFGVPLEHAVLAATANPAKAAGLYDEVGSLTPGKRADVVVWNRALQTRCVFAGGDVCFD